MKITIELSDASPGSGLPEAPQTTIVSDRVQAEAPASPGTDAGRFAGVPGEAATAAAPGASSAEIAGALSAGEAPAWLHVDTFPPSVLEASPLRGPNGGMR